MAEQVQAPVTEVKPEMVQPQAYAYPFAEPAYQGAYEPYQYYGRNPFRGFFRRLFAADYEYPQQYQQPMYEQEYVPRFFQRFAQPYAPQYAYAPAPVAQPVAPVAQPVAQPVRYEQYPYGYQGYYNPHPVRNFFRNIFQW